jgi:integrase
MIFRNLAQGIKIVQSLLAQMVSFTLSDGRNWGIPHDSLDEIRARLMPARRMLEKMEESERLAHLPVINSMRAVTCPHQRAVAVLTQIVQRMARVVSCLADDPSAAHAVTVEAAAREALSELQAALELSKASAPEAAAVALSALTNMPVSPDVASFQYFAQKYVAWLSARVQAGRFSREHCRNVRNDLLGFAEHCGDKPFAKLVQHDLASWVRGHPSWKSISTKRRVVASVMVACSWMVRQGFIGRHPFNVPDEMRGERYQPRRSAQISEYIALMRSAAPRELRRGLFFLRRVGCRTCEMRELRWRHLTLDGPSPHARLPYHKTWERTKKPRIIGLDKGTARFLRNLQAHGDATGPDDFVFLNTSGTQWDRGTFNKLLKRWCETLHLPAIDGRRLTAYCLRHLYCVLAIRAGVPLRRIADQMGLASIRMIESVYGVETREHETHVSEVAEEIAKRRKRSPKKADGGVLPGDNEALEGKPRNHNGETP